MNPVFCKPRIHAPALRFQAACALIILAFSLFAAGLLPAMAETVGRASWYGTESGSLTANGEFFDGTGMTCAHRRYAFDTRLRVTNLWNGRTAICRVNDRGPARWTGRDIDVSKAVARKLGMLRAGVVKVRIEVKS